MSPCRICGCAPEADFYPGAGYIVFCPKCSSQGIDGVRTWPWDEFQRATDEWEEINKCASLASTPTYQPEQLALW